MSVRIARDVAAGPVARRRRNATLTRDAILLAAQQRFAALGYTAAGTRDIALLAGADPVLIRRYFGSKEGLFREALDRSFDLDTLLGGDRAGIGARTALAFAAPGGPPLSLAMLIRSHSDPVAGPIGRQLYHRRIVDPLAAWLGDADRDETAIRLLLLWTGFFVTREWIVPEGDPDARIGDLADWVGRETQAIVDAATLATPASIR